MILRMEFVHIVGSLCFSGHAWSSQCYQAIYTCHQLFAERSVGVLIQDPKLVLVKYYYPRGVEEETFFQEFFLEGEEIKEEKKEKKEKRKAASTF
jgi:hypothetical protein